jgi:hypothetical protein
MNRSFGFLPFLILATLVGCQRGDKQPYADVKGTVKFNGTPIEKGQITFALEGRPPSTMDIVNGKYSGQAMVGSNRVTVSAKRKVAVAPRLTKDAENQTKGYKEWMQGKGKGEFGGPPADYDPTMVEYIPPEWGTHSTQTRMVEAGGANEFDFDIKGAVKK